MKLIRVALRSANQGFYCCRLNRSLSSLPNFSNSEFVGLGNNGNQNGNSSESIDESTQRIFSDKSQDIPNSLFRNLDRVEKARNGRGMNFTPNGDTSGMPDENDFTFTSLNDNLEKKLKEAATYFEVNPQETMSDDYNYRPDMNLRPRMTYTPEDLNIRKPGVWKPAKRNEFQVTSKEVLQNADFRNVRFLANFLTEAGIIIKRSKTGISAKAQRKVAREIKIARAFGLLPFTTMGTKAFVFGKSMENLDQDFELDPFDVQAEVDDVQDPVAE